MKLITVEYRATDGTYVSLGPCIPLEVAEAGDGIELHRPDGTSFRTTIVGFLYGICSPSSGKRAIVLSRLIFMSDVPRGTEVWRIPPRPDVDSAFQ